MSLTLHNIHPKKGAKKAKKRVGRGLGSKGSYSGRGVKGQRARSGGKSGLRLKGLRKIMLSTPKVRGFHSPHQKPAVVNISQINKIYLDGAKINPASLLKKGLVSDITYGVKILGAGSISRKITVVDCSVSESAKKKIEEAGGTVVIDNKK